ncbi:Protein RecA [compost metagenome]
MTSKLDSMAAEMAKLFAEDKEPTPDRFLSTGYPPLDLILSGSYVGGFPEGRIAEVYGPPASGKTLLATLMMIQAQRAGGMAIFVDHEHAFNQTFAASFGLDLTFPRFMYIDPDTWEQGQQKAFTVAEYVRVNKAIDATAPIVIVTDCIAAATPKSVKYDSKTGKLKSMEDRNMNDTTALARATAAVLPQIADVARQHNVVAIYLNQLRTKPGVTHGDPSYTPGGGSPEYYSVTRLAVSTAKIMKEINGKKEFAGREITLKCTKSKTTRPFQETKLRLTYDADGKAHLDFTSGLVDTLVEMGKIEKDGKMVVWEGKKYWASVLSKKIDDEGRQAELTAMLHA